LFGGQSAWIGHTFYATPEPPSRTITASSPLVGSSASTLRYAFGRSKSCIVPHEVSQVTSNRSSSASIDSGTLTSGSTTISADPAGAPSIFMFIDTSDGLTAAWPRLTTLVANSAWLAYDTPTRSGTGASAASASSARTSAS